MKNLNQKTVVLTGAASGIGRALAIALAKEGSTLVLADLKLEGLKETQSLLPEGSPVHLHSLDVSNRQAVEDFSAKIIEQHGDIHLLINNAGVGLAGWIKDMSYEEMEWIFDINFWGTVYGTKSFLPKMLTQSEGHIVNVSSIFGIVAVPSQSAYNATKFAVKGFTEALRLELLHSPLKVSCVHPGGVRTNIVEHSRFNDKSMTDHEQDRMRKRFNRIAQLSPEEAAAIILKGIKRDKKRILVGKDARFLDIMARLKPTGYDKWVVKIAGKKMGLD